MRSVSGFWPNRLRANAMPKAQLMRLGFHMMKRSSRSAMVSPPRPASSARLNHCVLSTGRRSTRSAAICAADTATAAPVAQ